MAVFKYGNISEPLHLNVKTYTKIHFSTRYCNKLKVNKTADITSDKSSNVAEISTYKMLAKRLKNKEVNKHTHIRTDV